MPKATLPTLLTCGVVGLLLAGCGSTPAYDQDAAILDDITAAGEGSGTLDLVTTAHIEWQRMVIACPDDDAAQLAEIAGGTGAPVSGGLPDTGDDANAYLVFVNGSAVESVVTLPRDQADPCGEGLALADRVLTPGSSTLTVEPGTGGGWIVTPD